MTIELSPEVRTLLDRHLDAVEAALQRTGRSREQRRAVVDDLETQILDMLAREPGQATAASVNAVLARLDPPEAYAESGGQSPVSSTVSGTPKTRFSRIAIAGLVCIVLSFGLLVVTAPFSVYMFAKAPDAQRVTYADFSSRLGAGELSRITIRDTRDRVEFYGDLRSKTQPGSPPQRIVSVAPSSVLDGAGLNQLTSKAEAGNTLVEYQPVGLFGGTRFNLVLGTLLAIPLALAALGTILGWVAFGEIRASRGKLRGKSLAFFDGLFYPALLLIALILIA